MKKDIKNRFIFPHFLKWTFLGTMVGVVVGLVIGIFLKSLEQVSIFREQHKYIIFLLPTAGATVSYIYAKIGKESIKGNNLIFDRINKKEGVVPFRMAPLVFWGTVVTHLFGGSAGREGTGVQIGASISGKIGSILKLRSEEYRIMLITGVSSGFGSVFGTPISGTIFGLEVATIGRVSYEALIPCSISSIVGNFIVDTMGVEHGKYSVGHIVEPNIIIVIKIIIVSIIFGLISRLFSEGTHKLKNIFNKIFKNKIYSSFFGGIVIIVLTILIGTTTYLGLSLSLLDDAFKVKVPILAFMIKLIFTSITLAAGFQGGEVTPLFVIGATLGNALAVILGLPIGLLAAMGMISVFAGATNTPIASFIMGIELFGSNGLLYIFIAVVISYIFSGSRGIYDSQELMSPKINNL